MLSNAIEKAAQLEASFVATDYEYDDAEVEFVRAIELYQAGVPERTIDVYFLCYADSVEESGPLLNVSKDQELFGQF